MYRVVRTSELEDVSVVEQVISTRGVDGGQPDARSTGCCGRARRGRSGRRSARSARAGGSRTAGESLGAIRVFHTGRATSREEIVELVEPDRRFSYALELGLPLQGYRADVDLEPRDGGTAIHWHSSFHAKVPGTGGLFRRFLGGFIQRCVDGLATYAAETSERSTPA